MRLLHLLYTIDCVEWVFSCSSKWAKPGFWVIFLKPKSLLVSLLYKIDFLLPCICSVDKSQRMSKCEFQWHTWLLPHVPIFFSCVILCMCDHYWHLAGIIAHAFESQKNCRRPPQRSNWKTAQNVYETENLPNVIKTQIHKVNIKFPALIQTGKYNKGLDEFLSTLHCAEITTKSLFSYRKCTRTPRWWWQVNFWKGSKLLCYLLGILFWR